MNFNLFGRKVSVSMQTKEHKDILKESIEELMKYKNASEQRKQKAIDQEKWFRALHWDFFRQEYQKGMPEPTTNYLMSNILNKHADFMDSYPKPNLLPEEQSDESLAELMTSIVPTVIKRNKYKKVFSNAMYTKLKQGYCYKAVTWDPGAASGMGDIKVNELDVVKVYTEPGIKDIQDSKSIYVVDLIDNDKLSTILQHNNPELAPHVGGQNLLNVKEYPQVDDVDTSNMTLIVDKYYKKNGILHFMKFIEGGCIFWSEDPKHEGKYDKGFYHHGQYPITVDVLIPEPNTIYGIGFIDIMKNPQMYIDKFDQIMQNNMFRASKSRFFSRNDGSINMKQFNDWSVDVVECEGNVGEDSIREFKTQQIDPNVIAYREAKISELKEVANTNEFSRGEAGSGVTAYRAIAVLQEAANKVSRDMIAFTYDTYAEEIEMVMENIKQFYNTPRMFRITNDEGVFEFKSINGKMLADRRDPELGTHTPIRFDIDVVPEKDDPFSSAANNELQMELFKLGFFNPQVADQALIALENMNIAGKEKIKKMIKENAQLFKMAQMAQQLMEENNKLKAVVQHHTGVDMGAQMPQKEETTNDQSNSVRGESTRTE